MLFFKEKLQLLDEVNQFTMANEEHLSVLRQGVEAWNQWREENPDIQPNLSGADLRGANLNRANLSSVELYFTNLSAATLSEADLTRSNLRGANLLGAKLQRADLHKAELYGANLNSTNLSETNLSEADLTWVELTEADLARANLSSAKMGEIRLGNIDLQEVQGLETVQHLRPSTIGIDTIYRSKGKIPEVFLRGCGVPDTFITYIASLTDQAIQFYSCFISYSHKDEDFAQRLHNDLQAKGVRCWYAPEDIAGGKKLYDQIDQAIRLHDKLLLVLSEHSLQSEWVMTEIRRARKLEVKEKQRKLFPIRLVDMPTINEWECFDADTGKDLAVEVREYYLPDFSSWKEHDAYQKGFDRLMRDLKAEA
jgi:hypothetical protein